MPHAPQADCRFAICGHLTGGIELGLERTGGFETKWQVEIDPYAQRVLAKHWPDVGRWDDVRTFPPHPTEDWACDVICGGFPCQDISNAGRTTGIDGARSGLWSECNRIIRNLRPRYILLENVAALLVRGMDRVLGNLAEGGYDAWWECIPACAVGARHLRDRVFIIGRARPMDNANSIAPRRFTRPPEAVRRWLSDSGIRCCVGWGPWSTESSVDRTAYGVPSSVDRKRLCGNAVVPACAEYIGRLILDMEDR